MSDVGLIADYKLYQIKVMDKLNNTNNTNSTSNTLLNIEIVFTDNLQSATSVNDIFALSAFLFSAVTIFLCHVCNVLDIIHIQQFTTSNTSLFFDLIESKKYTEQNGVRQMMEQTYVDWGIFNISELPNTSIHTIWCKILTNMERITQPHNNFAELSKLLPEFNQELGIFEFLACNDLDSNYFILQLLIFR